MLETPRLILRPGKLTDAPSILELNSDPEVLKYTGDYLISNILEAHQYIKERLIPQYEIYKMSRLSVFLKDGTYIGSCGLKNFPEQKEVDLGYRFMKKFWGQGYATEAAAACLKHGFQDLKLTRIIAKTMPENIGSIKVLQKLGMSFRGYVNDPSDPHSFVLFEMKNEEFEKCVKS